MLSLCACLFELFPSSFSSSSAPRPTIQYKIVPSNPPEVSKVSWCGCHVTDVISFWCPRNVSTSRSVRMSKTFSCCPLHPLASQLPFAFHFKHPTWFLCAWIVAAAFPDLASHNFTRESLPPDAKRADLGCQSTHFTSPPWPDSVDTHCARAKSKTLTVVSSEHDVNFKSLGENANPRTGSVCALSIDFKLLRFVCQYLMHPASSPERNQFSLCANVHVLIAQLCA